MGDCVTSEMICVHVRVRVSAGHLVIWPVLSICHVMVPRGCAVGCDIV